MSRLKRAAVVALLAMSGWLSPAAGHADLFGVPFLNNNPVTGYGLVHGRVTHLRGRPRPQTCPVLADAYPATALWEGSFVGSIDNLNDREIPVGGRFCFLTERRCRAWLYDMNSVNKNAIRSNYCKPLRR